MGRWKNRHFQLQLLVASVALVTDILLYFIGNTFRLCMRKFYFLIIFYRHLLCSSYESLDNQTRELANKTRRKKKKRKVSSNINESVNLGKLRDGLGFEKHDSSYYRQKSPRFCIVIQITTFT